MSYPYEPGKYPYLESIWDEIEDSKLDMWKFADAWAKIITKKYGNGQVKMVPVSITNKKTGEEIPRKPSKSKKTA